MENQKLLNRGSFWTINVVNNPNSIQKSREKLKLIERETELLMVVRQLKYELNCAENSLQTVKNHINEVENLEYLYVK